jgi:hypothetical protein
MSEARIVLPHEPSRSFMVPRAPGWVRGFFLGRLQRPIRFQACDGCDCNRSVFVTAFIHRYSSSATTFVGLCLASINGSAYRCSC